ncbi:MAG: hypothetical protein AAF636_27570 [Pseudomonadota bacterium]
MIAIAFDQSVRGFFGLREPSFGGAREGHPLFVERHVRNDGAEDPVSREDVMEELSGKVRGANPKVVENLTAAQRAAFERA